MACSIAHSHPRGTWIPAFAGMTELRISASNRITATASSFRSQLTPLTYVHVGNPGVGLYVGPRAPEMLASS